MDFKKVDKYSTTKFEKSYGDVMTLDTFISSCESGCFIDWDGMAGEILLNGNVIYKSHFYPSDLLEHKQQVLDLQNELGELEIVWYNK